MATTTTPKNTPKSTTNNNPIPPASKPEPDPSILPTTPQTRLAYLYKDITRLSQIASPHIILHPADRNLTTPPRPPLVGIAACQAHEEAFLAATGGTLAMEAESINVSERGCLGVRWEF
jgi:hypothetical protein